MEMDIDMETDVNKDLQGHGQGHGYEMDKDTDTAEMLECQTFRHFGSPITERETKKQVMREPFRFQNKVMQSAFIGTVPD
jgi:hypothetical protein